MVIYLGKLGNRLPYLISRMVVSDMPDAAEKLSKVYPFSVNNFPKRSPN